MKSAELKKTLTRFDKKELIRLIIELAKLRKDNRVWLDARLMGQEELPKLVEHYKEKILNGFWELDLKVAKKGISDFKKASKDREGLIDLMIYYVEQGTEFTRKYGEFHVQFYTSMKSMYRNVIKLLNNWGDKSFIEKFMPRLKAIVTKTEGMGWGYHDTLGEIYYDELGEEE